MAWATLIGINSFRLSNCCKYLEIINYSYCIMVGIISLVVFTICLYGLFVQSITELLATTASHAVTIAIFTDINDSTER